MLLLFMNVYVVVVYIVVIECVLNTFVFMVTQGNNIIGLDKRVGFYQVVLV